VGNQSYPGDRIKELRKVEAKNINGKNCHTCLKTDGALPCAYSNNAFGLEAKTSHETPPTFFNGEADAVDIDVLPSTAFIWPYEEMYRDEVKAAEDSPRMYDYDKRLEYSNTFFDTLDRDQSLVFYYANKSNPFSTDDDKKYVLVGVSRIKEIGKTLYYENSSDSIKEKYANGFIWQRGVTSHYPEQGFKLPLQKYVDDSKVLEQILIIPEQSSNFKYAARHITDDDALDHVERLLESVRYLKEIKDKEEDWSIREKWLLGLLEELWQKRGAYPGLTSFLSASDMQDFIPYYIEKSEAGESIKGFNNIIGFLTGELRNSTELKIPIPTLQTLKKHWDNHYTSEEKDFIVLCCRFELSKIQWQRLLKVERENFSVSASLAEIIKNPYFLCQQYIGKEEGDIISFNKIDHGSLPAPDLGLDPLFEKGATERLKALIVQTLERENKHTFIKIENVLQQVNRKLSYYPDWKSFDFNHNYILNNEVSFEDSIVIRKEKDNVYLYLKNVWADERAIEKTIKDLITRTEIKILKPITEQRWHSLLYDSDSQLPLKAGDDYEEAITGQISICSKVFRKPISIITGGAGTGKTTVLEKLMKAMESASGNAESFCLLAPTGKAADRIREKTGREAQTIHSFLTHNGWMRENYTFRQIKGKREGDFTTYIIDETSMMDLSLFAAFVRSVNWDRTKRLILVGDANQLPPIGRGKVFDDIIKYLQLQEPDSIGKLEHNLRQLLNKVTNAGNGILKLASLFIQENLIGDNASLAKMQAEEIFKEIQTDTFDQDVSFYFWNEKEDLDNKITQLIDELKEKQVNVDNSQILSPYRGEFFGTESINILCQEHLNSYNLDHKGNLNGITLFDKVIQFRNRAGKDSHYSYNFNTFKKDRVAIYNGEMGRVWYHNYDKDKWKWSNYNLKLPWNAGFQVKFQRKENHAITFSSDKSVEENIELAYAISIHKAQGSEFDHVILIVPKSKATLLSPELLYTGLTRASKKLHIFLEEDYTSLINMRRPEKSHLRRINASTFTFDPLPEALTNIEQQDWFKEGLIHTTLTQYMVRSKSEVIISNLLHQEEVDFQYEIRLVAQDGSFYLPDFTLMVRGETYFWEHLGMVENDEYNNHWKNKKAWYEKHFAGQLLTTEDSGNLTNDALQIIKELKSQ
jgi:hypothetical protein